MKLKKLNHEPYQDVVVQVDCNALKLRSFQIGTFGTEVTTRPVGHRERLQRHGIALDDGLLVT
jgi:hypothetical protein